MKITPPETHIRCDKTGFQWLVDTYAQISPCFRDTIKIDMQAVRWLDAHMCAPLGAILYDSTRRLNNVQLTHLPSDVETILSKNGFLSHYGREQIPDVWETTIPYQRFDTVDRRYFAEYIQSRLANHPGMPEMSHGLLKKFHTNMFEIFGNAVDHSGTELGVFCCGQLFPNKDKLAFAVADLGMGIRQKINKFAGKNFSALQAIGWAVKGENTTKAGTSGGLGLKLLIDFIDLNGGKIQILSDCGHWWREKSRSAAEEFKNAFPGTVIAVEINTADTNSCIVAGELTKTDIF